VGWPTRTRYVYTGVRRPPRGRPGWRLGTPDKPRLPGVGTSPGIGATPRAPGLLPKKNRGRGETAPFLSLPPSSEELYI
jgi:hypothetical protein